MIVVKECFSRNDYKCERYPWPFTVDEVKIIVRSTIDHRLYMDCIVNDKRYAMNRSRPHNIFKFGIVKRGGFIFPFVDHMKIKIRETPYWVYQLIED